MHWFRNKDLRNFFVFFLFLTAFAAVLYAVFPKHVLAVLLGYACAVLQDDAIYRSPNFMNISS